MEATAVGPRESGTKDGDFAATCHSDVAAFVSINFANISPYTHVLVSVVELFFSIFPVWFTLSFSFCFISSIAGKFHIPAI